ncbi:hypothetical protein Aperf_G00000130584 [Anoplocephala perfoliata]
MSNLELPPFTINMPFVDAIRRDKVGYVESVVHRTPCMATALFYTVDETSQALCLFNGTLNKPTILLLTPIAYAMLFNNYHVLSFLLKHTRNPAKLLHISCYTADCLDPQGIWFHLYRLLEFPPFLVRRPNTDLYAKIVEAAGGVSGAGFNQPYHLSSSVYKRNQRRWKYATTLDNAWEMIDCSAELFIAGCDARKFAAEVDFEKLMLVCQENRSTATHFVYFLQLLLFHGADLTSLVVLGNYLNALQQMLYLKGCSTQAMRCLFIAVFNLAGEKWLFFKHIVEKLQADLEIDELPRENLRSLKLICVRRTREVIPGVGFLRNIWKMEELDEEAKLAVITGLTWDRWMDIAVTNTAPFDLRSLIRLGRQEETEVGKQLVLEISNPNRAVRERESEWAKVNVNVDSRVQLGGRNMFKRDNIQLWRTTAFGQIRHSNEITKNAINETRLHLEVEAGGKEGPEES